MATLATALATWRLLARVVAAAAPALLTADGGSGSGEAGVSVPAVVAGVGWGRGAGALVLGYLAHVAPYLTVHRELFVVYYAPPYLFALLLLAKQVDDLASTAGTSTAAARGAPTRDGAQRSAAQARSAWAARAVLACGAAAAAVGFAVVWPLATGHGFGLSASSAADASRPLAYLNRLGAAMPSCWAGACFNAPKGTPLASALKARADLGLGAERAAVFPLIAASM